MPTHRCSHSTTASRRTKKLSRWTGLLLFGLSAPACHAWRTEMVTPAQAIAEQHPEQVRVTEPSGARLVVLEPTVAGDTLRGRTASGKSSISIPLARVLRLETRKGNAAASRIIAAGLGAGFVAILACSAANC
jgi:hypothetical protein